MRTMADVKQLEKAEQAAQKSLDSALGELVKAQKAVDAARVIWMKANKALIEGMVREGSRRNK
jgi:hypothetical protein